MITAGVDLASQDFNTASCSIRWEDGAAFVQEIHHDVCDDAIGKLITSSDKTGIDAPFGWPIAFAEAVGQHSARGGWPETYEHAESEVYRLRRTDISVRSAIGSTPLSVSTDRIAFPAMRAAGLLATLPVPVARDGSGAVVEAYPAAALRLWGLPYRKYKRRENTDRRIALVTQFTERTRSWLHISLEDLDLCRQSDDAFDALIAALIARALPLLGLSSRFLPPIETPHCVKVGSPCQLMGHSIGFHTDRTKN